MSLTKTNNVAGIRHETTVSRVRLVLRRARGAVLVVHAVPVGVVVATSCILLIVAHQKIPPVGFLLRATATILMTQIAIGALNDYLDRAQDAVSQPSKPIPSGLISARAALGMSLLALVGLVALGATFGPLPLVVILAATSGGILYDLWLKQTPISLLGYLIGFLGLGTWIWLVAGHLTARFLVAIPLGGLIVLTAHLAQSLPDIETDRALGHQGLAVILGPVRTYWLSLWAFALTGGAVLVASAHVGQLAGLGCAVASLAIGGVAFGAQRNAPVNVTARKRLFSCASPGLGLLAVATLLLVNP